MYHCGKILELQKIKKEIEHKDSRVMIRRTAAQWIEVSSLYIGAVIPVKLCRLL